MATLHPRGINHLALSTTDMKAQLTFWCDVLGLPLKALYHMHGVPGAFHGFVELAPDSYVAFVQHPDNDDQIEFGVSHADGGGGAIRGGTMQHVALHVDSLDEMLELRDRIRAKGVAVLGPIDHGFVQSMYFEGPEGLNLEIATGADIPAEQWIDPEVVDLCGIDTAELAAMRQPEAYACPTEAVANPSELRPDNARAAARPDTMARVYALDDALVWDRFSETTPPVAAG